MTSIRYEQERIKFEKEALKEYDRELWYSIEKCRKKKDDEKASDEAVELLRQNSEMERKKRRQRF